MSAADAIACLFKPRSVAVIGASADPRKTAGRPIEFLLKHGYDGAIYPVNPRAETIAGLTCYPSIDALPETPEVAVVLLNADRAIEAVAALSRRGTTAAIVLASGYSETGEVGIKRQADLRAAAGAMRILGPNTIGLVNLTDDITLSASGALDMATFPKGRVALVSQSGGILGALLSRASARGIGLSKLISTSNEVDLDLADFVDVLADDPATTAIALYIESIRDPATFLAAARKAAQAGKPIVAFKIGRSESGAQAAASHTGAMAGADRMYDALFEEAGVIRAATFADLLELPAALACTGRVAGNRVAILTSTGGAGTLVADSLGVDGFDMPKPDASTAARLVALQDGDHAALDRNPIDVTLAGLQPDLLRTAIGALLESDSYDALVVIVGSSGVGRPELMADALQAAANPHGKPVLAYVSPHAPRAVEVLSARGVATFVAPESLSAALRALLHWSQRATRATPSAVVAPPRAPVALASDLPVGSLDEAQAKHLFAQFGVPVVRETIVDAAGARAAADALGSPVVVKMLSSSVTHKSDVGGVAVNVSAQDVAACVARMIATVQAHTGERPERFLIQEMVPGGVEVILGFRRDALGGAVLLGMGGVMAELMQDTTLRLLPADGGGLSTQAAHDMIRRLKMFPLLDGYRGRALADVAALTQAIVDFSWMAAQLGPRLLEAEINPLFVLPQGQGVRAADGVAVLTA